MRQWGSMAVMAFFLAVLLFAAHATTEAAARTVRVGYYMFDGYQMQDEEEHRSGYGYDFLQEAARYTDWQYEYVGYTYGWARLQKMLDAGEIDILTSARKTPERLGRYLFSESIGTSSGILSVKSGNSQLSADDYSTYQGIRVGMIKDSSINKNFAKFAAAKGFAYVPVEFLNTWDMDAALQDGSIDAICTTNLRRGKNEWIVDQFDTDDFYAMLRPDGVELKKELDEAIQQMDRDSPGWRTALWNKYYRPMLGTQLPLTVSEKAFLAQRTEPVTVLVNPDNAPYSSFVDGKAKGILPEILAEISRRTGLQFEIVETADRAAYFSALIGHQADICLDSYFDYDKLEKNGYQSTLPYLSLTLSQVVRKDLGREPGSVAMLQDIDYTPFASLLTAGKHVQYYPSVAACLIAVRDGQADAAYIYSYAAQKYLGDDLVNSLNATLLQQYGVNFSIAVGRQQDPRLLRILNKAAASVRGNYVNELVLRQTGSERQKISMERLLYQHPLAMAGLFAILAAFVCAVIFSFNRQRLLRVIQQKNEALSAAVQQATEANEAKSVFLSGISHDMRTPLNGIIGFTRFAMEEKDPLKKQADLQKIQQSGEVLLELINNTLDLSRIESGKFSLEPVWIGSHAVIDSVLVVIRAAADKKKQSFAVEIDCPEDEMVYVDPLRMKELFLNLLSNAVKYTPEGGHISLQVQKDAAADGKKLYIRISDTGVGIHPDFLPKLYEPFTQERQLEMRNAAGSGLGLAIVKRIVDLMDGEITVTSALHEGTTFTVCLPVKMKHRSAQEVRDALQVTDYDFSGRTLLLCEDNELNSEIARMLLEGKQAKVVWVGNGADGVKRFAREPEDTFDAILMDIHMPVLDGYGAARQIRAMRGRKDAKHIPILAMTADAYAEDVAKCLAAGMDAHIAKPIEPQKLFAVLQELLEKDKKSVKNVKM